MTTGVACPHCGSSVEPGQRFCKSCGRSISGVQGAVATRQVQVDSSVTAQIQRGIRDALQEATLGEYEILAELGRGGMATVFLAQDIQLDRKVAIKVMSPSLFEGDGMIERFKLEARTAAGLSHPHIIPIYAVRETDKLLYFVMKFIEGRALDSIIDTAAPLPVPLVQNVITKVAEALGYAHRQGVVHRDIKPANIMIDTEGMPIVTDFGIAKVASKQGLTMTGATIGTPTYMSPEQCNAGQITGSSDQYSLGCVAYEMLTGHPPFDGDSVLTIMFKHVSEPAPASESLGADCPPELAAAVRKMLAKKPEDRFPTIEAAAAAIGGTTLAYDDPIRTQMMDFAKEGAALQVLRRVSTPRSPIPAARTRQGTSPSAKTLRMSTGESTGGHGARRKRRTGLWIGLVGIVLAGGAVALWLKPWAGMGTAAQTARTDTTTTAAPAQTPPAEPPAAQAESAPSAPVTPQEQPPTPVATQKPAPKAAARPSAPVATKIVVGGAPSTLRVGDSVTLSAQVFDQSGRTMASGISWQSSDPAVLRMSADGRVAAVGTGVAAVTARAGTQAQVVTITIVPEPVASVRVTPAAGSLEVGRSLLLTATPYGARGVSLAGRPVTWSTSAAEVATVSANGRVSAAGPGSARITATSEGHSGAAEITVTAPAAAPPSAANPADERAAVDAAIQRYGQAIQSERIDAVRQIYPGISSDQAAQFEEFFQSAERLKVLLTVQSVRLDGNVANATVEGVYDYTNAADANNHAHTTTTMHVVLGRNANGVWLITAIR